MGLTESQIQSINNPIGSDNPVGSDVRSDNSPTSIYYEIKDKRNAARTIERQVMDGNSDKNPLDLWQEVKEKAIHILSIVSKDLEIAVWLIEALLRTDGYAGLAQGFDVSLGLLEAYWDLIYPLADEDGMSTKLAAYIWLNGNDSEGTLAAPMINVPIITLGNGGPLVLWQYKQSLNIEKINDPKKKNQRISEGVIDMKDIQLSVIRTPAASILQIISEIELALTNFTKLSQFFDDHCEPDDIPPSSNIKNILEACLNDIRTLGHDVLAMHEEPEVLGDDETVKLSASVKDSNGLISDRESALRSLANVANYFKVHEPQSPLPYLIERTIRWGGMSLGQLLGEIILDDRVREDVCHLTGIDVNNETTN